jgi:AhpD family alkylhydroperoxidase
MRPFPKRTYRSLGQAWADMQYVWQRRPLIRSTLRRKAGGLSPQFRERLMLAVTAVNECRYCAYFHLKVADSIGLSEAEARAVLDQRLDRCPPEEIPALLYAQHWAEHDAWPEPELCDRLIETYGREQADQIELILRLIRIGNLTGNSVDAVLYSLSGGRLGHHQPKGLTP